MSATHASPQPTHASAVDPVSIAVSAGTMPGAGGCRWMAPATHAPPGTTTAERSPVQVQDTDSVLDLATASIEAATTGSWLPTGTTV